MTFAATVGLGLRLAVGRGRAGLVRVLLMSTGVGVGVALVIGGLGIGPALDARHARDFARTPALPGGDTVPRRDYVLVMTATDRIGDHDVVRIEVAGGPGKAPLPPGLARLPEPGEQVLSPALAEQLRTPLGRIASQERYRARPTGRIGPQGLLYPDELVAYVGRSPSALEAQGAMTAIGWGSDSGFQRTPLALEVKLLILIGVISLLVPTLVFVVTSTRLSAASRERRLAAIRLVGATPGQARLLAAIESGVAAAAGSVLGVGLFFALRPLVANLSLAGFQWFASDIAPPVGQVIATLIAAPLLAVAASLAGLRRLIVTPLGVARRARVRRAGPMRLALLAAGLAAFGLCWVARDTMRAGGGRALMAMGGSFLAVLAGVALAAPWLGSVVAPLVTRSQRALSTLLGARRLQQDPTAAGRVVGAIALLVCAAGVALALVPPALAAQRGYDDLPLHMPSITVMVAAGYEMGPAAVERAIGGERGVTAVAPLGALPQDESEGTGVPSRVTQATIVDCAQFAAAMKLRLPGCGAQTVFVGSGNRVPLWVRAGAVIPVRVRGGRVARVHVPPNVERAALPKGISIILPPQALPPWARRSLITYETLVGTDGTAAAVERVRNGAARLPFPTTVTTLSEARADAHGDVDRITSLVDLGIAAALGIALANLLVVTIDHVTERRRPVAVLAASGVPLGIMRRSVAAEIGLPLLTAIAFAMVTSLVVAGLFGAILREPVAVPLARAAWLVGLAVAMVAAVTALTIPSLARAARPETLQTE